MEKRSMVYDVRPISTLRELIETSALDHASRTAFVLKKQKQLTEVTYAAFLSDIKALSTILNAKGFEGKKIAVIGKNSYEWALTYLAVTSGVGVIVPVDKDLKKPEIENILSLSGSCAVIYSDELEKTIAEIELPLEKIAMSNFPALLAEGRETRESGNRSYEKHKIDPFALGILLYTSGTTGVAKGVMLSQFNICSNIVAVAKKVLVTPEDRTLSVLPLHHTYECMAGFLSILYAGGSISYMSGLAHLLSDFREYKPTVFVAVPLLLKTIHTSLIKKMKAVRGGGAYLAVGKALAAVSGPLSGKVAGTVFHSVHAAFGGRLRAILCGAAALDPDIQRDFERLGFRILCGYGLTETSPVCLMHNDFIHTPGTVGIPVNGLRAKIIEPNDEGIGELAVKGANVMLGYYNNPEATAEVIDADGYFHTGDLVKRDALTGEYTITGRIKNMIVIGNGKKIFPEEIEYLLEKCPAVSECMAYGSPSEKEENETVVTVKIFPNFAYLTEQGIIGAFDPEKASESENADTVKVLEGYFKNLIKEDVNAHLPAYKAVRKIKLRYREFDKTSTRKIRRNSADNLE